MTSAEVSSTTAAHDPFAETTLARVVPAIEAQREVWLAAKLEPAASLAYNEGISLHLRGNLDTAALHGALQELLARHDALRATLSPDGAELCIAESAEAAWAEQDLSTLDHDARDAAVAATLRRAVETPFDLEHGPLLRAELLRLGTDDHLLVLSAHHIVCDGWSWGVLMSDLAACYAALLHHQAPALDAADSFADYALEEIHYAESDEFRAAERYWLGRFDKLPPALDLPTDRPRPRVRSFASQRRDCTLDPGLVKVATQTAAQQGASLYALLLATFALLLHRLSEQDDLVIGIPAAGQAATGRPNLVGHSVNILPLRCAIDGGAPFAQTLSRIRGDLLDAVEHQRYTFGTLLKRLAMPRDPARLPLVNVLFNLDRELGPEQAAFEGLEFELATLPRSFENFELFVNAVQLGDGALSLECQFNSDLFDAETIDAWLDAYATLLRAACTDPARSGDALEMLSPGARAKLDGFQPPAATFHEARLAHEYFERAVDRAATRQALRCADIRWTYAELESRANRIAHALRARGVGRGALVGLALARGPDMIASVLAVLKAGAGYVPLDPSFPVQRLAFMASDASLAALIVDDAPPEWFEHSSAVLSLAANAAEIDAQPETRLPRDERSAAPDSIAYVIYTSGSTGQPKGVQVPHRTTSNLLTSMQRVPGIDKDDRLVAVTTLSFDIAFVELMLPLCAGAEVVIADHDQVRDGAALRALIENSAATVLQATPSGWRILLDSGWTGHPRFKAITGGEPLTLDLAEALLSRCGEVWNGYGPTETTVYSTYWRVAAPRRGIFIGQPIANTDVRILDERGMQCPVGAPGEITIGGAGVSLGYLGRPELTAERFIADSFFREAGTLRYRTGDRGRWRWDGNIEHLGRLDFQVKVRGYRIELGEIESALVALPEVARAVVVAREERLGDTRLVAYVVLRAGAALDSAAARTRLKQMLPEYMIPQHVVLLDAIPQLPNGKIDRKALPAPTVQASPSSAHVAPRNEHERRVATAMEEILALPGLGIHDDFFALGGHSLLAAQLTARLNREFGLTLSLRTLFDSPTIAGLSAVIEERLKEGQGDASEPIEHRADQSRAPLSLVQQRMWLLEEMNPGRVNYNTPSAHRLRGRLDEAAFERAFREMVRRQSALRTAIVRENGEPMQVVEPEIEIKLFPAEDLSGLPAGEREAVLMDRLQRLTDTPFDLSRAPLFRVRMFRMAADEHVLFFMPHHIIWDGWSFDLVYGELSELYRAYKTGSQPKLPALPVSYGDFAVWHTRWLEGPQLQSQLAFWRDKLATVEEPQNLPADKPRKPGMSGEGRTEWIKVSGEQTDAMRRIAREADATLNMALLALYYVLLFETMGQRNLVIGTPVRGRSQVEIESVMGCFNNLVPLYLRLEPNLPFTELVRRVKRIVVESFEHPDVPLEHLQSELKARHGGNALLYQALFSFQDARQRITDWAGLSHEQILLFQSGANEDLGLWFLENNSGMIGGVTFNADVFRPDTARMLRERYLELLSRVIDDPDQAVSSLTRISDADLAKVRQWNMPKDIPGAAVRIEKAFEARAERAPAAIAVAAANKDFTCAEIERLANQIAACLHRRGVGRNSVVALAEEQGADRTASLLGIWKAGGICLPLEPADPPSRLKSIIVDANVAVVIGRSKLEPALDWPRSRALWLDADQTEIVSASESTGVPEASADDAALLIYPGDTAETGSARIFSHREIGRNAWALRGLLGLGDEARVLGTSAPSTAMSMLECVLPMIGGAIVAARPDEISNGTTLIQRIRTGKPDIVFAATDIWKKMLAVDVAGMPRLKAVCFGGTPKPQLVEKILARHGELWNALSLDDGIVASCGRVESTDAAIHAGGPLAGNVISIVGDDGRPQPIGAIGEICVAGDCAGQEAGSLEAVAAQAARRTGFRGRWLAGGEIEELGRLDRRICASGRVVDPAAIEQVLRKQAGVEDALVISNVDADGAVKLIAYAVRKRGASPDAGMLQRALKANLPAAANPSSIAIIDGLPRLPNGKIDQNALSSLASSPSAVQIETPGGDATRQNLGALERGLVDIWRELLRVQQIGIHDDFFDLGGDSLLAVRMFQRAQKLTGINLPLATLLTAPTIARQAAAYRAAGAKEPEIFLPSGSPAEPAHDPWAPLVPIQPGGSKAPLFCVHAVGGNVLNYVPLAKALDEDQPFYGLQAIGLDGITPPIDSLTAMATRYVAEIRKLRPHGPYFLAGGSMGGMIAYEMAQQLRAAGEKIALLALFDTYGPENRQFEIKQDDPLSLMGRRWRARLQRASGLDIRGKAAMFANAIGWRMRRAGDILRVRWSRARGTALPHELRYREVERIHEQAYLAYKPKPYEGSIVLFRAAEQCEGINASRTLGWEGVVTGGIEIVDLPGGHDSLIEQPLLVENLRKVLERAQAAAG